MQNRRQRARGAADEAARSYCAEYQMRLVTGYIGKMNCEYKEEVEKLIQNFYRKTLEYLKHEDLRTIQSQTKLIFSGDQLKLGEIVLEICANWRMRI